MIKQEILDGVSGKGPLITSIKLDPIEHIYLRPDIIFELTDNKKVLHLGCTDHIPFIDYKIDNGIYLHRLLSNVASKCLGIDINAEAIEHLHKRGITNTIVRDITESGIREITDDHWDYLVMGEMLEHINNPVQFIKDIAENYRDYIDRVIITVPNAFAMLNLGNVMNHGVEGINSDHKYWFTPYTLCKVAYCAGLNLENLYMCAYETQGSFIAQQYEIFRQKPMLLDNILLESSW